MTDQHQADERHAYQAGTEAAGSTAGSPSSDRTAELEARIRELERRSGARGSEEESRSGIEAAFWAMMHSIFPEEARKHLKAAGREQLLAARVYLDRWIAQLDEQDEEERRSHERIEIE